MIQFKGFARKQNSSLQESIAQIEQLIDCSIDMESGASKITVSEQASRITISERRDVVIRLQDYSLLLPGCHVARMGKYGWNGQILKVEVNSALVNWGNHTEWLDRVEIYPLDRFGKPFIPGEVNNIREVARRARLTLKTENALEIAAASNNQLRLF